MGEASQTLGRWSLSRRLVTAFVAFATLLAVLSLVIGVSLYRLQVATHDRVERYGPALLETETLARAYSDQETGLRGFLVAGRVDFLQPYTDGRAAEAASLAHLETLLALRPDLLRRLAAVRREAGAWDQQVAAPAIARVKSGGAVSISLAEVEAGKQRFDRVRAALAGLQTPVRATRDRATRQLTDNETFLLTVLVLALVGLVIVAWLVWIGLRRWVTLPLQRLGAEVDRVEGGDLSRRVTVTDAPSDIVALAEQVELMRGRILHEYALAEAAGREATEARALVEEQAQDLRRSNAELEQFAYVASHDLQEPLRKVASFCQLIERRYKGQLDERGEQYIEFAVDGAKRMQQLINDLLTFSRVGRAGEDFQEVRLEVVLAQAVRQLDLMLAEGGATVTHDPLPVVRGDQSLLVQLLQNLIGNGVKFRGDDPPRVHLSAAPSSEDPTVWELSCTDNGIGIDEQYQEKIFVIFQRLHGRDAYDGTGIGLAMCKKIVEYHGGRLWLDTSPRSNGDTAGAVFRWTLPVVGAAPKILTSHSTGDEHR